MDLKKITELITHLHRKSMTHQLEWRESYPTDTFQVSYPNFTIQIGRSGRFDSGIQEDESYILRIMNDRGRDFETIHDNDLNNEASLRRLLKEIYQEARRTVLGTSPSLDEIISKLKESA